MENCMIIILKERYENKKVAKKLCTAHARIRRRCESLPEKSLSYG